MAERDHTPVVLLKYYAILFLLLTLASNLLNYPPTTNLWWLLTTVVLAAMPYSRQIRRDNQQAFANIGVCNIDHKILLAANTMKDRIFVDTGCSIPNVCCITFVRFT